MQSIKAQQATFTSVPHRHRHRSVIELESLLTTMPPSANRIRFATPLAVPPPRRSRQVGLVYPKVAQIKGFSDWMLWPDIFWGHFPLSAIRWSADSLLNSVDEDESTSHLSSTISTSRCPRATPEECHSLAVMGFEIAYTGKSALSISFDE